MEDLPDQRRTPDGEPLQGEVERAGEWQQPQRPPPQAGPQGSAGMRAVVFSTRLPRWLALLLTILLTVFAIVIGYLAGALALFVVFAALLYRFVRKLLAGR